MRYILILTLLFITMACTQNPPAEEREIVFHVEGMFCESCVGAVTNEMRRMNGVSDVSVSLADSSVVFTAQANRVPDREQIRKAIEDLGYTVHFDLNTEP